MKGFAHSRIVSTRALLCAAAALTAGVAGVLVGGCADRDDISESVPGALVPVGYAPAAADLPKVDFTETSGGLAASLALDMVYVEGGSFKMGCSTGDNGCESTEKEQHDVTLTKDYFISKYQVTNALWDAVMPPPANPPQYPPTAKAPKTSITWYEAVEFTCALSKKTGKKYRLATEAEWEFAARGGKKSKGYRYAGSNDADAVAWTKDNVPEMCFGGQCYPGGAQPVGGKAANELGIFDMSGNVYEWTFDNWRQSFPSTAVTDPLAPHKHTQKVRRGGSAGQNKSESRVSGRKIRSIDGADGEIGIRLALSVADSRPEGMDDPCELHAPPPTGGAIGLRDVRLITGSDSAWVNDMGEFAAMDMQYVLKVWPNGTARMSTLYNGDTNSYMGGGASGEWYTLNCFDLRIVGSSSTTRYAYYVVSPTSLTIMSESGNPFGRFEKVENAIFKGLNKVTAPNIQNPRSAETLAPANGTVDMENIPANIQEQDKRLIDGAGKGWWQNNENAGGSHNYRKDFDTASATAGTKNNARFVVYDPMVRTWTPLAEGEWFTVANTFLRIKQKSGNSVLNFDYLYTVSSDGNSFNHISFQRYEAGDFRMFKKTADGDMCNRHGCWWDGSGTFYNQGASTYLPPIVGGYPDPGTSSIKERERRVP